MLACQRSLFSIPEDVTYLDAAYMAPIPRSAVEAGGRGAAVKAAPWEMTINSYYDEVEDARRLAASLIGARPDDIAIVPATSYGIAVAAANVDVPRGSVILMMENEHTSHRYAWYELAKARGAEVVTVRRSHGAEWGATLAAAIRAATAPVSVVAGTLVHWFEGTSVDMERVAQAAREAGASLVMDGTQWVGAVPFDVARIRPDFLAFATYKFLLGPYRMAFLYASETWQRRGSPIEFHSWNRRGGERPDFYLETLPDYLDGARRFDMGERSDFAVLPVAIDAMKLLQGWGISAVGERLRVLNHRVWEEAERRGFTGPEANLRAGHISVIELGDRLRPDLSARLRAEKVFVTVRGTKMRVTPHVYNHEGDIETLFDCIEAITA